MNGMRNATPAGCACGHVMRLGRNRGESLRVGMAWWLGVEGVCAGVSTHLGEDHGACLQIRVKECTSGGKELFLFSADIS